MQLLFALIAVLGTSIDGRCIWLLKGVFATKDLKGRLSADGMQVKEYVQRQWTKILAGRVSLADFVFAKEVRLGTYSARHGIVPPAAIVAGKAMASDPRMEPRYGERVPYVVVYGEPGLPTMA